MVCPRILCGGAVATAPWAAPNLFPFVMSKGPAAGSALTEKFLLDKKLRGSSLSVFRMGSLKEPGGVMVRR